MAEIPLLLNDAMVRATLAGLKTQTRRPLRPQPYIKPTGYDHGHWSYYTTTHVSGASSLVPEGHPLIGKWVYIGRFGDGHHHPVSEPVVSPFGKPGDTLYVRECWKVPLTKASYTGNPDDHGGENDPCVGYRATMTYKCGKPVPDSRGSHVWKPSIHMPKWASRLHLPVKRVWVERVQNISEADARAEGLTRLTKDGGTTHKFGIPDADGLPGNDDDGWQWREWEVDPRKAFAKLWDSIYAKRGLGWALNPWVWCCEWEVVF